MKLNQTAALSDRPFVLHTRVITGNGGGPEKTILNSPRFLRELGYESECAFMHPPEDPGWPGMLQRAEDAEAELISVPDRGPLDWRVIQRFATICRERQPLIWHAHDYKSNALGILLRRWFDIRLVTTVHGWTNRTGRGPLYYRFDQFCLPHYEKVLCVSDDLYEACVAGGVRAERCQVVENAIDETAYTRQLSRSAARAALGIPAQGLLVASVGRLSPEKGYDLLIEAVRRVIADGHAMQLAIAGDGTSQQELQQQVNDAGLQDRVRLLGYVADPRTLYQAMDLFVLSSYREGLPNVLLEAMASGVPSIATRIAGVPRLITDGQQGLLVAPGSVDELDEALRTMAESPELQSYCGERARQRIVEQFSFSGRMKKVANVYDELLGRTSDERRSAARGCLSTRQRTADSPRMLD